MKTLSKEAEKQILDAIQDVCEHVNGGDHPTDAVVKVAQDYGLSKNFIRLVCCGYNTGYQDHQRESSDNILDKLAEFPLADATDAIDELYPDEILTPSEEANDKVVSDDYKSPPVKLAGRKEAERQKIASIKLDYGPKPAPYKRDPSMDMAKAYSKIAEARRDIENYRCKYSVSQDVLLSCLKQASDYFRYAPEVSFTDTDYFVGMRSGDAGRSVMDYIHISNGGKEKRASAPPTTLQEVDWNSEPYSLVAACIKAAMVVNQTRDEYMYKLAELSIEMHKQARPYVDYKEPDQKPAILVGEDKSAGMMQYVMGSSIARQIGDQLSKVPPQSKLVDDLANEYDDPELQSELQNIRNQTMLVGLMRDDEVLSGQDPKRIIDAYNELVLLAPRTANQPAVVRPILRKMITGHTEPFEVAEMVNIEKNLGQAQYPGTRQMVDKEAANVLFGKSILV